MSGCSFFRFDVIVAPEHIQIGAGYDGEQISIEGIIAADADAYIRVTGQPEHVKLKQKGKALGYFVDEPRFRGNFQES